jgi:hypothetical protein
VLVTIAWHHLYGSWPRPWELGCIFLHDIGHLGKDYLSNLEDKKRHWELGARIAMRLFGPKGFYLIAGHCEYSGELQSILSKPDKYSWYISPRFWLYWNDIIEPKLRHGLPRKQSVDLFQAQIRNNIESGRYGSNHQMYLDRISEPKEAPHD